MFMTEDLANCDERVLVHWLALPYGTPGQSVTHLGNQLSKQIAAVSFHDCQGFNFEPCVLRAVLFALLWI